MSEKQPEPPWIRTLGLFGLIVSDLLVCSALGIGAGYFAQQRLGAPAWVMILSSAAGLSLAFFRLYRYSKRDFG